MLLRVGVISISLSLFLALAVAAVFLLRGPEEQAATEPVAKSEKSEPRKSVDREIPSRESADLPVKPEPEPVPESVPESVPEPISEPEPEPVQIPEPEPVAQPEPISQPEPVSQPEAAPEPAPIPKPKPQDSLPVAEETWPKPESAEVAAASKPRRYSWVRGAIMTLTVDSMGILQRPCHADRRPAGFG